MDLNRFKIEAQDAYLLTIDLQEKLVPTMYKSERCLDRCILMLKVAEIMNLPGTATEQYPRGLGASLDSVKAALDAAGHKVYDKVQFDAYLEPVAKHIRSTGRRSIIICGIEAHICVYQTVRRLLEEGYHVFVPADAISSRRNSHRKNALRQFEQMGACVTNTETIVFDLMKAADQPQFKPLSKLIK